MPFPLHKVPVGLLSILRGRTLGRNPDAFSETVTATLEGLPYYASDLLIPGANTPAVGGLPNFTTLTITGQVGVLAVGCRFTCGAAAATNIFLDWGVGMLLTNIPLGSQLVGGVAAASVVQAGAPVPFFIPPIGSTLFANVSGTAAGADHQIQVRALLVNLTAQ